jgi:hypothetical protein
MIVMITMIKGKKRIWRKQQEKDRFLVGQETGRLADHFPMDLWK